MNARIVELERLVQTHYDWLDAESANGTANLPDRSRFFLELYSRERLERCRFEYLDLLRGTAHDTSDKEVLEHYLFLEPS
jgi:hypothetical protein